MKNSVNWNKLSQEEEKIIVGKATEAPFSGEYDKHFKVGTYVCRRCNQPLFDSKHKFDAGCGWPSFDGEIRKNVLQLPDSDGLRTEIQCGSCKAHLGHVFTGERFTASNTRHCVNSLSIKFIAQNEKNK